MICIYRSNLEENILAIIRTVSIDFINECHLFRVRYSDQVEKKIKSAARAYEVIMQSSEIDSYPISEESLNFYIRMSSVM